MPMEIDISVNVRNWEDVTRDAVRDLASLIRAKARADIAGSGHFPRKWIMGLTTGVRKSGNGYVLNVYQRPSFGRVFEYGGSSEGEPLLWFGVASDTRGISASKYPGKLIRPGANRGGFRVIGFRVGGGGSRPRNILIDPRTRQVKYIGVERVVNPQRWNIRDIAVAEAEHFLERLEEQQ